jgi:hypothetical protein
LVPSAQLFRTITRFSPVIYASTLVKYATAVFAVVPELHFQNRNYTAFIKKFQKWHQNRGFDLRFLEPNRNRAGSR